MPADRLLTIKELCNYLSVSSLTIRRLRAEGIIRAFRMRRSIRFRLEECLDALARADEEYGLRRREALIPSGGPKNKLNAMFNGKLKGLCNLNTVDLDEEPQKDESSEAPSQRREGFARGRIIKSIQRDLEAAKKAAVRSTKKRKRGRLPGSGNRNGKQSTPRTPKAYEALYESSREPSN